MKTLSRILNLTATVAAIFAASACGTTDSSTSFSVTRDTRFAGRGNVDETLLYIKADKECEIKSLKIKLDAKEGDVGLIHAYIGDESLYATYSRTGKDTYLLHTKAQLDTSSVLTIGVDIADDAIEGDKVSADVVSIKTNDGIAVPEAPQAGAREILLARKCLYMPGDYGSKNYRIPAIRTLADGSILAVNDKRKYNQTDLPEDIDIIARHSTDGGRTWSEPVTIAEGKGVGKGFGDPCLVQAQDGTVICGFVGGAGLWNSTLENPQKTWIAKSTDGGQTWNEPEDVTAMIWGPKAARPECRTSHSAFFGSGNGLLLKNGPHKGRIILVSAITTKDNRLDNYAFYSDDNGQTWNVSEKAYEGGDEAKVVELTDGSVLMSIRQKGDRGWNISMDGGETWGEQQRWTDIHTNACDGDIIRYDDNTLLHSVPNSMKRENVSIFVSKDEGKTWPYVKSICPYGSVYSSLTVLPDGTIGAYIEENPDGDCQMWFLNFSMDWLMRR